MKQLFSVLMLAVVLLATFQPAGAEDGSLMEAFYTEVVDSDGGVLYASGEGVGGGEAAGGEAAGASVVVTLVVVGCSISDGVEEGRYFYVDSNDEMQCLSVVSNYLGKDDVYFS